MMKKRLMGCLGIPAMMAMLGVLAPGPPVQAASVYVRSSGGYDIGTSHRFGIGLQSGGVSGLSLKYFLTPGSALQIGLGGSPWGFGLNLEYLVHPLLLTRGGSVAIPLYLGLGLGMGSWQHGYWGIGDNPASLNVHVPLGIAFQFRPLPIDVFLQIEPGLAIVPYISPSLGGTLGARIFF